MQTNKRTCNLYLEIKFLANIACALLLVKKDLCIRWRTVFQTLIWYIRIWYQIQLCKPLPEPFSRFQQVKLWTGCRLGTLTNQSERERYNQMSLFECLVNERSNRQTGSERAFITDRVPAWPQTPNNSSWIWPRLLKTFDMEWLQSQLCLSTME